MGNKDRVKKLEIEMGISLHCKVRIYKRQISNRSSCVKSCFREFNFIEI